MAFWSDINNTPEPLRQYRWYLQFGDNKLESNLDKLRYALMECGKPEMEITTSEHLLLNHYFKYPGLVKWKPINIKVASVVGQKYSEDASRIFHVLANRSGYYLPNLTQENNINKIDMITNIENIEIIQINTGGAEIEKWLLYNPLISNIKYGNLSYASEDIVTIDATINYDFAELKFDIDRNKKIK